MLLIEADPKVLQGLARFLEDEGCEVLCAHSGRNGLRVAQEQDVDVVVVDLLIPDVDGLDLVREFSRLQESPRIIAVTGAGRVPAAPVLSVASRVGAHAVFQTPLVSEVLIATIRTLAHERMGMKRPDPEGTRPA